ncbi:cation:proton antiporter [Leeia aquatica]|nr:cation:proton antiporter [Leeia aquatica]
MRTPRLMLPLALLLLALPSWASSNAASTQTLLWVMLILLLARFSSLIERIGQPAVLGELLAGVALGNLALAGLPGLDQVHTDPVIRFLAELGVVILLFQIGLESNLQSMKQVGGRAFAVATVGVVVPFALGTLLIGPWLLPQAGLMAHLFLGAALTATSVGITGRVFRDAQALHTQEARIVLGAAVIDDVMGLVILAVVAGLAKPGSVDALEIARVSAVALLFLIAAVVLGRWLTPLISRFMASIHSGPAMQFTLLISFCLGFAWLSAAAGLAPIVGAFAAGLILDASYLSRFEAEMIRHEVHKVVLNHGAALEQEVDHILNQHAEHRPMRLMEPIGYLLTPIFFVVTGMQVKLDVFSQPHTLLLTALILLVAIVGKLCAGLAAGKSDRWLVGWGMVPRGEVGLIFAQMGKSIGALNDELYSVIVLVVVLSTLVTPPLLAWRLKGSATY